MALSRPSYNPSPNSRDMPVLGFSLAKLPAAGDDSGSNAVAAPADGNGEPLPDPVAEESGTDTVYINWGGPDVTVDHTEDNFRLALCAGERDDVELKGDDTHFALITESGSSSVVICGRY